MNLIQLFEGYDIEEESEKLRNDCEPFLKAIGYNSELMLYRGTKAAGNKISKRKARLGNRKPLDTPQEAHDAMNVALTKKLGHPFRNGVFATGSPGVADSYGSHGAMFPIGQYEFAWSEWVTDLRDTLGDKDDNESMETYIEKLEYKNTGLKKAIREGVEVMFWVDSYYIVPEKVYSDPSFQHIVYMNEDD